MKWHTAAGMIFTWKRPHAIDKMIGELWHWVQSNPGIKTIRHSLLLQTTGGESLLQMGRSWFVYKWIITNMVSSHWSNITPLGEMKNEEQL
jgi:hypothetical protein